MNKLIKPEKIDNIIRSGVVLKSRKAYKANYSKKLQILREMPYEILHYVIKHNALFDYINSVGFMADFTNQKLIEVMKGDLKMLKENNKIFTFKSY